MSRHARVKREEAKQGLSLHDVRMNGLTIRGVIRTGDAERIDCPAPMQGGDVIRRRWNNLESIKAAQNPMMSAYHDLMIATSSVRVRLV